MALTREERDAEIVRRAAQGEYQVDIGRDFGLTGARVSQIACSAGIRIGKRTRVTKGEKASRWNGGHILQNGYWSTHMPGHPRASKRGYVLDHILIAERVLGKPLPSQAQVHHANRNPQDNRNCNLVICQDQMYHHLLHRRMRAKEACGNPNWQPCKFCKRYDDPSNLVGASHRRHSLFHAECQAAYRRHRG